MFELSRLNCSVAGSVLVCGDIITSSMSTLQVLVDNLGSLSVPVSLPLETPADADDERESNEDDSD